MDIQKQLISAVSEIGKSQVLLHATEHRLEMISAEWIEAFSRRIEEIATEDELRDVILELTALIGSFASIPGSPYVNVLHGEALTMLLGLEKKIPRSKRIMKRLLDPQTAKIAEKDRKKLLAFNPTGTSTKVAYFEGIEKLHEADLHLSPDDTDDVDTRAGIIENWLAEKSITLDSLDGIACRAGFLQPIPSGTYRVVPEMLNDLAQPRIQFPTNMSIPIILKLAKMSGRENDILLTTSDTVVSDEVETVERLTGFVKFKRDGTGGHYLTHKAVLRVLASVLGCEPTELHAITAHLGYGVSIALHRGGQVTSLIDGFSGVPSANRCGPLDLPRLLKAIKDDQVNLKEMEAITLEKGGLFSLAGTDDFHTLSAFRQKGATETQQQKIELIFEFFARQITAALLKLTSDGKPVRMIAMTGDLTSTYELVKRIRNNIAGRYPIVIMPETLEVEALAGGLLRGFYEPENLKNYVGERDRLREKRMAEDLLIDTVIFKREIVYRKKDAPILTIDELIDATCITVKEHFTPTIAIVGANNEEAILAAKRANEEGIYRIAKFNLLGDYAAINQIAYDYDLVIDNDNFTITDTDNPIEEATRLLEEGKVHILMKGKLHTDTLLRGVFQFLKKSGKLKKGQLLSHIFVMDIPVRNKLLLLTDAAVNTYPDEGKRIKIIENALTVAYNLNIKKPKVAVISAIENVNPSVESSIEAERIATVFKDRSDCIVEGPLSFDVAMDQDSANDKGYRGQIRGTADILAMPEIDAGNVLYKSLTTQSGATSAGIILGGDMPIILTSRGDSARSKLASISLAVKLFFDLQRKK